MWLCEIDWTAVSTIALVFVTGYYAISTHKILRESHKTRQAVERQASAVEESNKLLITQIQDNLTIGLAIVDSSIEIALQNIEYWKGINISHLADLRALPSDLHLVPRDAQSAIYHARNISPQLSELLTHAFADLGHAQTDIGIARDSKVGATPYLKDRVESALDSLEMAYVGLKKAQEYLYETNAPAKKDQN